MTIDTRVNPADPVLPEAKMHLIKPKEPAIGRVVATRLCTKGDRKAAGIVRHIEIDISDTPIAGQFLAGQSFGVLPPGEDSRGRPHALRLYSIASPTRGEDGKGNILATTVKRTIAEREPQKKSDDSDDHSLFLGIASNYLCDLNEGDEIKITGPQGKRFLLPVDQPAHDYIFLATGTGIAPFRGMLLELLEGPDGPVDADIHLIMGTPFRTDLLYDIELRALENQHERFHYHTAISRENMPEASGRGEYVHQVLTRKRDVFQPMLQNDRTLVYVCGIQGMQFGVYQEIMQAGAGGGFLQLADDLDASDYDNWTLEDMKRRVRPTHRMMLEVY